MAWYSDITVELPLLLSFFSFSLTGSVYTNLIIFRTCYLVLDYNETECALLGNSNDNVSRHLEKLVEPDANIINMARSTTESVFSIMVCLFAGPWSDRFGRKPILIMSQAGYAITFVLISIFCYFPNISPWYSIICSIPLMITGGGATYLTVILSYITDVSSEEKRGMRMAIFEAVLAIGTLIGNTSSSFVLKATSYTFVFAIAAGCGILGLLYTIFCIPESLENRETEGQLNGILQMSNLEEMVKASVKKRESYDRAIILLTITLLTVFIFIMSGDGGPTFLFLREKFSWTLEKYTLYSSAHNIVWIVGTMLGSYVLNKMLRVPESVLTLMGLISVLNSSLLQALATNDYCIYAAGGVRLLGGVISPMMRTLVSKLVPQDEIAKVFAMIMASEFLFGLGASPLYTWLYNATIDTDAAIFNFLSAGLYLIDIVLIIIIMILQYISSPRSHGFNNEEEILTSNGHAIN